MSEFRFICPFCDTPLDCPEELDGVETECPVCHTAIVPTISNGDFSEFSEAEELRKEIDEQWEEFLQEQEQEQKQEIYPFIAKCPACKKVIELEEELKYSKQQCPFCNKIVLLNTITKNQIKTLSSLSLNKKHNAHQCRHCKNIIIVEKNHFDAFVLCPCCKKDIFISKSNLIDAQGNENADVFISKIEREAHSENKNVFMLEYIPQEQTNEQIIEKREKKKKEEDAVTGCAIGTLVIVVFIIFCLGSCISSCDTSSTEMSEEAKTYLMLKEAQDRLEKRKKERTIENLVDIMDRGY